MNNDTAYEAPSITGLGEFTAETGEFLGPCPEAILIFEDHSCP
ncbi:hypothetical protein [Nocardiopsis sp. HUAS JQ3]|nr:hypothetical protein [Nocardiopsis sp. HUAS JQ3]WDZ90611.1 hypothetical protein PV789_27615 [Nocardiopsis sp. HUAS JQ3]